MARLTAKQKRFIDEYLIDLNATQAAIRAGYSTDSAKEIGSQNLAKPNIQIQIDKAMAERSKRTGISQDRVLQELARIAFVDVSNLLDVETAAVLSTATADDLAVIQGIKVKESHSDKGSMTEREVRLADKLRALEMLGRHLGMFNDKLNLAAEVNSPKFDDILRQLGGPGLEE